MKVIEVLEHCDTNNVDGVTLFYRGKYVPITEVDIDFLADWVTTKGYQLNVPPGGDNREFRITMVQRMIDDGVVVFAGEPVDADVMCSHGVRI